MENLLYLFLGMTIGGFLSYLFIKLRSKSNETNEKNEAEKYVPKEIYTQTVETLQQKEEEKTELVRKLAVASQIAKNHQERLEESKEEVKKMQESLKVQFENLSNEILEKKSKKFLELNEEKVSQILNPLKEKIQNFEKKVEDTHRQDIRERSSLKQELENIMKLNRQVSEDATKLTNALKGDTKLQGNWGEVQLELILTKAGLEKGIHYRAQESFKDESGRTQRPDYIINLPEKKNLIIDSKVSLVAYEQYFNAEDEQQKTKFFKSHIRSIENHISDLGGKNYQNLYNINPPDYVLLFVAIEPALYLALREEPQLFEKALDKNVILVSTSTLLATLRTISYIWKQDNQRKNVVEIAKESGALYDKFVGFMDDLVNLGKKIDGMKGDYSQAMNKLFESKQRGGTIVGKMEAIKKLGANASKSLSEGILQRVKE